jgi:hypothetical protein
MSTVITDLYRQLFGRGGTTKGTDIDMAEHGRAGGLSTGQPFKFTDGVDYAIKMTEDGNTLYIAYAVVGSIEADAVWKAMKIDQSSGLKVTWADGGKFSQIATNLIILTYS